ncbi:MAG: hypothetical protein PQJ47_00425 [Sphaerochaetaceae bacterium]|nr:hypothetical protein [Sphaerochaetaceae bacterium]MDC7248195.1 hypothetical protein [Sphaerochaetaceae bacterium]
MKTEDLLFYYAAYFLLLSFTGWIIETVYRSGGNREFTNAGLLRGPYVPIYGTAATMILAVDRAFSSFPFVWEVLSLALFATVLEYFTSYILEKMFSLKLWDYSTRKFNLHGRISLRYSLYWVILVIADLQVLQPLIFETIVEYDSLALRAGTCVMFIIFIIDVCVSFNLLIKVRNLYQTLETRKEEISSRISKRSPLIWRDFRRLLQSFPKLVDKVSTGTFDAVALVDEGRENSMTIMKESERRDFSVLTGEILENPVYCELKNYHHHEHSIYDHSILVAQYSYKIGLKLQKVISLDMNSLVRGALLHDFFLYDWRKQRPENGRLHAFEHPKEAYQNATVTFGPLTPVEKDIILKHMWPLNIILPKYIETCIVTVVDKIVSSKEFIAEAVKDQKKKEEL